VPDSPPTPPPTPSIVSAFAHQRLLVIGDVMLDQFIVGRVTRISPEAPVPVVAYEREEFRAGGAANVAFNARALGASVELVGLVGADKDADRLRELLDAAGVRSSGLVTDDARRTTTKVRIVTTRNLQVARVDYESDDPATAAIEEALIAQATDRIARASAVVVSDYLKGVVTSRLMQAIVAAGKDRGVPVLVDPKIPHLEYYVGATWVTPNHHEAEAATHLRIRTDAEAEAAAQRFRERAKCSCVLITRGEHGMWLSTDGTERQLRASAREVADVTGAGDTVIATLALALASGASASDAAELANAAAGVSVGKFGPSTVTPDELVAAIADAGG
jgi:rfaE bifunctional protein kinase chain/domain